MSMEIKDLKIKAKNGELGEPWSIKKGGVFLPGSDISARGL